MAEVVVVGAGFAGLATAALLARDGHRVTVCEKNGHLGGRADTLSIDGYQFDAGPSWYLMPEAFDHFFHQCGTSTDQELDLVDLVPGYRIFPEGQDPVDIPRGVEQVAAFAESRERGAGAAMRRYLRQASEIYALSLRYFLYTTFRPREMLRWGILRRSPRIAARLVTSLQRHVEGRFTDPLLRQLLQYPAVFLSTQPSDTPALYQLMSHTDLVEGVRYPRGGFAAVVDAIARHATMAGAVIRLRTSVARVEVHNGLATGVRLENGELLPADVVVSTADLYHTEQQLLDSRWRTKKDTSWERRNPGISSVVVMLGVDTPLPELHHHNLVLTAEWGPDFAAVFEQGKEAASRCVYVSKTTATDPETAPPGGEALFLLIPTRASEDIGHGDAYGHPESPEVTRIANEAIDRLAATINRPDFTEHIAVRATIGPKDFAERYHSWKGSSIGPAHTLLQSAWFRGKQRSIKVNNLYFAGATTAPGVGVPMCLISAENVRALVRRHPCAQALPPDGAPSL